MQSRSQLALKVVLFYALTAAAWIVGSDLLVAYRQQDTHSIGWNIGKGLWFVAVTAALLFVVLRRMLRTEMEARARAETTARQLTELQQIAEHSGELFYKHDLQHRFTFFSAQAYRLLGYTPEQLQLRWMDVLTENPLNRKAVELAEVAFKTGQKQRPYLVEVRKQDGTPALLELDESPFRDASGQIIGMIGAARDVTQREKAERALRESEELYRTVFEAANDGIMLLEGDQFIDCNERATELLGTDRNQLLGATPADFSPERQPDGRLSAELQVETNQRALAGSPQFFQWQHRRCDGTTFQAEVNLRRFQLSGRKLLLAIVRDITARLKAEEALRATNQVYSMLGRVNEAIVRIGDQQTLFVETCRIAVEHGKFRMAWIGVPEADSDHLYPAAVAGHDDGYVAQLHVSGAKIPRGFGPAGTAFREGRVVICSDIATDPVMEPWREGALARGYRALIGLPIQRGEHVAGVLVVYSAEPNSFSPLNVESLIRVAANVGFALDLFERNRQREIEQQQLRLQQSALEAAANAIVITNAEGETLWVNEAFTRLTGYSRSEVLGLNPRLLKSGLQNQLFYREMWEQISAGKVWQGALTNKRKDESLYEEEMTITPLRKDSGEITHFIAIKQDVTERKRLEHQFLRAQRMQSIGLLAGGVAHDLNNVLAPVLMALPLLKTARNPEERDHLIETLERSVKRGANIVQQVLTYARGVEVQRVPVQLRHLVREVVRIAEETFPRDLDIRSTLPGNLWTVMGDPTQIHQVLLNLAVNARDAMPDGGELRFSARNLELGQARQFLDFQVEPGRYVTLTVSDTGTGIPTEISEHIFEPFFTTKASGKGTGLGLSTVLGIVKSHGGLVEVETQVGQGSKFTVYWPALATEHSTESVRTQLSSSYHGEGQKILVVDDEAAVLRVTQDTLKAHGYEVVTASDGREALLRIAEHGQTLRAVITDLMMPNGDGLALAGSLRKTNPQLPIIAITGLLNPPGEPGRAARLTELGIERVLRKPFSADDLLENLQKAIQAAPAS